MLKKVITMFVLSALLVCLSECATGEKKSAAEIVQTATVSELSDKSRKETISLSELSGKSEEDAIASQKEWKKA